MFLCTCITVIFYITYWTKALGQVQLRSKETSNKRVLLHLYKSGSNFPSEVFIITATKLASKCLREIKARQLKIIIFFFFYKCLEYGLFTEVLIFSIIFVFPEKKKFVVVFPSEKIKSLSIQQVRPFPSVSGFLASSTKNALNLKFTSVSKSILSLPFNSTWIYCSKVACNIRGLAMIQLEPSAADSFPLPTPLQGVKSNISIFKVIILSICWII